jgi:hypothetical protein
MSAHALEVVPPSATGTSSFAEEVLASLPQSFRRSSVSAGAVVVVEGGPGWVVAATAALRGGATGLIVICPVPADLEPLRSALMSHPATVVVDSPWSSNPAVPAAADAIRSAVAGAVHAECRLIQPAGADLDRALLHQLSLVRALIGPATSLSVLSKSANHLQGSARSGDLLVDLSITCTDASTASATTRVLLPDGSVEVLIPAPTTARPATVTVVSADGMAILPSLFESGHRATWRRLRDHVSEGDVPGDVDALQSDIALLQRATAEGHT